MEVSGQLPSLPSPKSGPASFALPLIFFGARCSSVVRAFAHGAMGRRIDPSWSGHFELFRLV